MAGKELNRSDVLNSLPQKFARLSHLLKAKSRFKEQKKIDWLSQYIKPNSVILDIGANFGVFAKSFSRIHNGSCTVQAFEPVLYNFEILKAVTNQFNNINIYNLALSDSDGMVDIFIPVKEKGRIGPALAHLGQEKNRSYYKETIKTVILDDYIQTNKITNISFIKCDVEGAELLVFKGTEQTLKKHMPTIFTEIDGSYTQRLGYTPTELVSFLVGLGYIANRVVKNIDQFYLEQVNSYTEAGDYLFTASTS